MRHALLLCALLTSVLAGCFGSSDDLSIQASQPAGPGQPWTFKATGPGSEFVWDLGDRLTTATGREVTHDYGMTHGSVTVRVVADGKDAAQRTIALGPEGNQEPTMFLDASSRWLVVGETVRLSGAGSNDPEGDPLRFGFACERVGDAKVQPPGHMDPPAPFNPGPGRVQPRTGVSPPAATQTVAGDLCSGLVGVPGRDATVEGAFAEPGAYRVTLAAGDPFMNDAAGSLFLYVTATRPPERLERIVFGNLTAGRDGVLDDVLSEAPMPDEAPAEPILDRVRHEFTSPLDARVVYVNVTSNAGPTGANMLTWRITQETRPVADGAAGGDASPDGTDFAVLGPGSLLRGGRYTLTVELVQGAAMDYRIEIVSLHDMDPTKVF